LDPQYAAAHCNLGNVLRAKGDPQGAEATYRRAIALNPNFAEAHCNLGHALRDQGRFRDALVALQRGRELGSKAPGWRYQKDSERWVRDCQRLLELDNQLPAILRSETHPADAAECVELARLCAIKRLNGSAARFYEKSFTADPEMATQTRSRHRSNAARVASLAGCGLGEDASRLDDRDRARWRRQALDWLQADLAAWKKQLEGDAPQSWTAAQQALRGWQRDAAFAGLRDAVELAKLPEGEREAYRKLWAEVEGLLAKAGGKSARKRTM
jgi:tetratricopeptide (TPR) repeat protein